MQMYIYVYNACVIEQACRTRKHGMVAKHCERSLLRMVQPALRTPLDEAFRLSQLQGAGLRKLATLSWLSNSPSA